MKGGKAAITGDLWQDFSSIQWEWKLPASHFPRAAVETSYLINEQMIEPSSIPWKTTKVDVKSSLHLAGGTVPLSLKLGKYPCWCHGMPPGVSPLDAGTVGRLSGSGAQLCPLLPAPSGLGTVSWMWAGMGPPRLLAGAPQS